jgi:hypothetical protein
MRLFRDESSACEACQAVSASALGGAIAAVVLAWLHMNQLGQICGQTASVPHCWACYAAPLLALLAAIAFVKSRTLRRPVIISHDPGSESLRLARHGRRPAL